SPQNEFVTVVVGKGERKEKFTVYKKFICYYSPFFNVAFNKLNGLFVEDKSQTVDFEDTTPKAFSIFVRWLYRQSIRDNRGALPQAHLLARLWILSDKLLSVGVQNAAIEGLCEKGWFGNNGSVAEISYVYKNTKAGSPLRQLLIDQITHKAPYTALAKALTSKVQDFPNEMLVDLILAQKKLLVKTNVATETLKAENYFIMDIGES
ncbi:hypothetical protein LAWI1_G004279, partial [Lachnellula willkommii]